MFTQNHQIRSHYLPPPLHSTSLQVCEYAMGISPAVPLSVRSGILAVWVQCKQLMQQPIASKTYGIEEVGQCH